MGTVDQRGRLGFPATGPLYPLLVLLTAVTIGALGLYPHLSFSLDSNSLEYFFYSYDEGYYSTTGLGARAGRTLGGIALSALIGLCGGNVELALITADFVFPFLAVLGAGLLAATIARGVLGRWALLLGLLFAAEYTSYLFRVLIGPWDQLVKGAWRSFVVEAPPILFLFRTPEPQISWLVAFLLLAVCFTLSRDPVRPPALGISLLFLGASVLAGLSYTPVLVACSVYLSLLSLALALRGELRLSAVLLSGVLLSVASFWVSLLFIAGSVTGGALFETSLPAISPLTLVSLGMVLLWGARFALTKGLSRGALQGALASITPIVLMNQQILTGRAIALKTWEEHSNHLFMALGIAWFFATLAAPRGRTAVGWRRIGRHLPAALIAVAILGFALERQHDTVGWLYAVNAEESAVAALLDEHRDAIGSQSRVLFDSPVSAQRLGIRSKNSYEPILNFDEGFLRPVPTLQSDPALTGANSPRAGDVYEQMWRNGVTPADFEALLREEARDHALVLTLFFSHLDAWGPMTTWRARQRSRIEAAIPEIVDNYRSYWQRTPGGAGSPVYRVSLQAPEELATGSSLTDELVSQRPTVDGRMVHLYRQTAVPGGPGR